MTPRERIEVALRGGKPDRVPVAAIYDMGYMMRGTGQDERGWVTATAAERIKTIEDMFLRHEVDCYFVHNGASDEFADTHTIEKHEAYWLITNRKTGEQYRLLPDGCRAQADGTPIPRPPSAGGVSKVRTEADLDTALPRYAPGGPEMRARYAPLRHLVAKYPDHHFSTQLGSTMVWALNACGGYVEGLTLLAEDRELFRALLARCVKNELIKIREARQAGAHSVWFTTYYAGADTISPRDYADLVFPHDREICEAAKQAGLFVLHWYLGDLMPCLDTVMRLPQDALVLEQGRKGYEIDVVKIRKRVGPKFCLFGFGYENDYCLDNREGLARELCGSPE